MVSSGHYLASHAAFEILQAGGNAVDAGVAAGIALGVVQSDVVNFAGVAPILIYSAETRKVWSISGLGGWPASASLDFFLKECNGTIPAGILRTVIPAAPDAWITALERFGTMSFTDVSAAAIRFARQGFVMYPLMSEMIKTHIEGYSRWPSSAEIYLLQGSPPEPGEIFRQQDLARTIQYMADQEQSVSSRGRNLGLKAARDAFYKGDIARTIVDYHNRHGGLLQLSDMASFSVEVTEAISTAFHDTQIYSCDFWCQGPVLLQILNILESSELKTLKHNSTEYIHLLTEAIKMGFADREAYYSDPKEGRVPKDILLSKTYAAQRLAQINKDGAWPGMPPAGNLPGKGQITPDNAEQKNSRTDPAIDTSYVAVIDKHGNAFSATPSDGSYNTPVIPGTGLCPSPRGSQSWAQAGHAAAIAAGRRPRLTPNPSMAIMPGGYVMPFGTPGGDVQCQSMLQTFLNVEVFNMTLQKAVEAPRFACFSFPSSFEPHIIQSGKLMLEDEIDSEVIKQLSALGHKTESWGSLNWRSGSVCMVKHEIASDIRWGAADPRRPSYALGW